MNFGWNVGERAPEVKLSCGFLLQTRALSCQQLAVYRFGYRLNVDRRAVWLIALANIIAAAIAFAIASLDIVRDPIYGESSPGLLSN